MALAERDRSGEGQWVRSSLLQAQIAMMDFQAARYLVDGIVPKQAGNDHPYSTPMGVVRTADGFINIGVAAQGHWVAFCSAIGDAKLATHPDYATQDDRFRNRSALNAKLADIFITRTSQEWLARLEEAGVSAGPIYKLDEVFADPQVQHLGIAVPVSQEGNSKTTLVGQPIDLSRTPAGIVSLLPEPGANNDEILKELGLGQAEIDVLREEKVL